MTFDAERECRLLKCIFASLATDADKAPVLSLITS
jgi:hypothetical protein